MRKVHVAIFDHSPVVSAGFHSILSRISRVKRISQVSSFEELEAVFMRDSCHLVLINPAYIQLYPAQFQQAKNRLECIRWIGVIYAHFPASLLAKLDNTVDVYDTADAIEERMNRWIDVESDGHQHNSRDTLTDREIEVLKLLAAGNSNKEIADKLNISTNTVITHRKNISQKTGIKSVSGLTIYAVTQNLISLDDF